MGGTRVLCAKWCRRRFGCAAVGVRDKEGIVVLRVLHGMTEAANQAGYAVAGLKELGIEVASARWPESSMWLPADYSLNIDRNKKLTLPWSAVKMAAFAAWAATHYDVYHFHCGRSLLPRDADLPFLRRAGKKYFFEYHGSEIRQGKPWVEGNPYSADIPQYASNPALVSRIERELRYAEGAIVHDAELALYDPLPQADVPVYFVPLRVDPNSITPQYPQLSKKVPLVVHAPSNPTVKGTSYIVEAIEDLQKEYEFDFKLITGFSHEEASSIYLKADIIIDQLIIGSYGVFALEGMMMGKPVLTYMRDDIVESYPQELPIVRTSKDTIKENLKWLLEDSQARADIGRAGRHFTETYHDYRAIAQLLKGIYRNGEGPLTPQQAFSRVKDIKQGIA